MCPPPPHNCSLAISLCALIPGGIFVLCLGHLSVPPDVPSYFLVLVKGQLFIPSHRAKAKGCTCRSERSTNVLFAWLSMLLCAKSSFPSMRGTCSLRAQPSKVSCPSRGSCLFARLQSHGTWLQTWPFLLPTLDPQLQEDCHLSQNVPGNVSLIFGRLLSFLKRNGLC